MPEPKGTANVGLVQKRAGYDLCKTSLAPTNIRVEVGTYLIKVTDYKVACNGTFVVTLPDAVFGQEFVISNVGTGVITVTADAGDTINAVASQLLYEGSSMSIYCYVANKWEIE
jgi:hypothetical protein